MKIMGKMKSIGKEIKSRLLIDRFFRLSNILIYFILLIPFYWIYNDSRFINNLPLIKIIICAITKSIKSAAKSRILSVLPIRVIVRKFGIKLAKPFPYDYRRPDDAEEILKKLPEISEDTIIGSLDLGIFQNFSLK